VPGAHDHSDEALDDRSRLANGRHVVVAVVGDVILAGAEDSSATFVVDDPRPVT
jgi:hypothetical protein